MPDAIESKIDVIGKVVIDAKDYRLLIEEMKDKEIESRIKIMEAEQKTDDYRNKYWNLKSSYEQLQEAFNLLKQTMELRGILVGGNDGKE